MAQSQFSLEGQTALVTGGTRGIGSAVALGLAEAGANVILVQRDTAKNETKERIEKVGRKVWIYAADMANQQQVSGLSSQILNDGHEVRILVTCAGIQRRHDCEIFPDDDFKEVIQVNLSSVFTLNRDFGAHMLSLPPSPVTGRRGSIINFASLLTFQGGLRVPAYAASKGGVGQLTKSFANQWTSRGVTVNAIAPGYIETEMNTGLLQDRERLKSISERIPGGRWGTPDDFKGTAVYLASRASAYVSGHILTVDGEKTWEETITLESVPLATAAMLSRCANTEKAWVAIELGMSPEDVQTAERGFSRMLHVMREAGLRRTHEPEEEFREHVRVQAMIMEARMEDWEDMKGVSLW